ncbi:MAG TPA: hypothetical protein VK031_02230 [Tissierellaceae bacterium]|nr:hypothetical protein [Tissierellaceae bacterium]
MLSKDLREGLLDRIKRMKVGRFNSLKLFVLVSAKEMVDNSNVKYLDNTVDRLLKKEIKNV